jgi:nucleotide-binding universal stress UspA family protein
MFIASAASHALHLEALLGAFTVGMALSLCSQVSPSVIHSLEAIALRIFAPVFFAAAGLKVSVTSLLVPGVWEYALLLLLVAILCKGVGVFLGARFGARAHLWEAVFYASGLNARGSMEIVVASIGLSLGVLSAELFSAIVMVAVITSVMAPPAMRYALRRIPVDPEEEARLERELRDQSGLIGSMQKVLLPVRARVDNAVGSTHAMQALLLTQLAQKRSISLTLFSVAQPGEESVVAEYLDHLLPTFSAIKRLNRKVVTSTRAGDEILDEIRRGGYDLVVMGTPEAAQESPVTVFSPLIDYVLRLAPCATILIQGHEDVNLNDELSRVLVPTNGSVASRRAAEIGFSLLGEMSDEVVILKVVEEEPNGDERLVRRQVSFGRAVVEDLAGLASSFGVQASGSVVVGSSPEEVILSRAANDGIGLIILGTDVRVGEHRLYLGARVERILQRSPCPVMIVNG